MSIAGFGTRFAPGAKSSLKLMLLFYYKPIIQYTIEKWLLQESLMF
ncbi:MAG: hypothetical protein IJL02_05680 [Methanobrevibacter sp.]|nr:hypothetical protein [Methanobrevibacter sp.]MBQ6099338.1 hypothetical protein [Methanobrevibacter sp.]